MFKKAGKSNLRKRRDTEDDDTTTDEITITDLNQTVAKENSTAISSDKKSKQKKLKKVASSSVLSFGDDDGDDEELFQIKKSSRSKRIAKQIKKRAQEEKEAQANGDKKIESLTLAASEKDMHVFQPRKNIQSTDVGSKEHLEKQQLQSHFSTMASGAIPTPSMIHAARKQREMLRKFGSEYIPIDDTQTYKGQSQSRLVREDDFDGSSDEEVVEVKGIDTKQKSKPFVPTQSDDEENGVNEDNHVDEEVDRWEEEMIKKGINAQTNMTASQHSSVAYTGNPHIASSVYGTYLYPTDSFYQQTTLIQPNQVEAKSDVTFFTLKARVVGYLTKVQETHNAHQAEMDKLIYDASECEHISKHLSDTAALSEEYKFYQEMKQYLRDLVGCLREKVPHITKLESHMHGLLKARSTRITSRRIQDVQDESLQSTLARSKAVTTASNDPDFSNRVRERQARRTRRRALRQINQTSSHNDGMSTDDEETSMNQAKFKAEIDKISTELAEVFDDVIDDFCNIEYILKHFDTWRKNHGNSYLDAYISLCIPKLVIPFVKHEMVLWNPLFSVDDHFEDFDWFKSLAVYGLEKQSDVAFDDDSKMLGTTVEKVIACQLMRLAQEVWDPLSSQQSARLSVILKQLFRDYAFMSSKNRHCIHLMQGICKRIQNCLENDIFIPLLPPSTKQDMGTEFLERQTWTSIKLFKNILLFDGVISHAVLCELAFDSLLNRYIILALQTSPLSTSCLRKCQEIVRSIPRAWFDKYKDMQLHLASLIRLLVHLAKTLLQSGQLTGEIMFKKEVKSLLLAMGARNALAEL